MIVNTLSSVALMLVSFFWVATGMAADAKPAWQATWEKTIAAAKKEGKLNLRRPLRHRAAAHRVPQRVSRDQDRHSQWRWQYLWHANNHRTARGNVLADLSAAAQIRTMNSL
jgi:hypothetical protein